MFFAVALAVSASLGAPSASGEEFRFLEPGQSTWRAESGVGKQSADDKWIHLSCDARDGHGFEFGDRVVVRVRPGSRLEAVLDPKELRTARRVSRNTVIVQTKNARSAARHADRLSRVQGVSIACPVRRSPADFQDAYAREPNDRYFRNQINLENRDHNGQRIGADLNVRSAWAITTGLNVIVGVADVGVETGHPDLRGRGADGFHKNFATGLDDGDPLLIPSSTQSHGTSVAGLIAAEFRNRIGVSGAAPGSRFAAWVILDNSATTLVSDEALMDMFQHRNDEIAVQNHSWGHVGKTQHALSPLEELGIEGAYSTGRIGLGVVMVRSGGNSRQQGENVNDDAYPSDPRVIAVAATDAGGRATSTSEPGAPLLVAAPVLDRDGLGILAPDLSGINGADQITRLPPDEGREDYRLFSGTSAAAPQISAIAAMILSANPVLHARDVQQILIHSARHFDLNDPDLHENGAGFPVSHNVGFGIPDAGQAVRLAQRWINRPPIRTVRISKDDRLTIPDAGLNLRVDGRDIPAGLRQIRALPSTGVHPDRATHSVGLVAVGEALSGGLPDLTGKAALIQRDPNDRWSEQVDSVSAAGAEFAVIFNNAEGSPQCPGGDVLCVMLETDYAQIPAVFISQTAGEALAEQSRTNSSLRCYLRLNPARQTFDVTDSLICEHISLRVQADHPVRGDLRITLTSPDGTTSILQKLNDDLSAGPPDWTYHSVHHFYESSRGTWTVAITDEFSGGSGAITNLELVVRGTPINDSDADGLDDTWELTQLGGLTHGPTDDPDHDGYTNAREQILNFDPSQADIDFRLDLSPWNQKLARLSWPATDGRQYEVLEGDQVNRVTRRVAVVEGAFPESEYFTERADLSQRFFSVRELREP